MKVKHAVIMAAGISSRFAPLSYEKPKALLEVRGEILIERQIEQLLEAGVPSVIVVTGYKAEMFNYLTDKYPVTLIFNEEYNTRNNNGSLYVARDYLSECYICSADNYFTTNPFDSAVPQAYYAVVYTEGETDEWCVSMDDDDLITGVAIGGHDAWTMLGHAYFDEAFAHDFVKFLLDAYDQKATRDLFWENIYIDNIDSLHMKAKKYPVGEIHEFDSLDDLRSFDPTYLSNTRSLILQQIASRLHCREQDIRRITPRKNEHGEVIGFHFVVGNSAFDYLYLDASIQAREGKR